MSNTNIPTTSNIDEVFEIETSFQNEKKKLKSKSDRKIQQMKEELQKKLQQLQSEYSQIVNAKDSNSNEESEKTSLSKKDEETLKKEVDRQFNKNQEVLKKTIVTLLSEAKATIEDK